MPAMIRVQQFLSTFQKFPPRQRPASFTIDQMTEKFMQFKGR
jgi:arylsulfatase